MWQLYIAVDCWIALNRVVTSKDTVLLICLNQRSGVKRIPQQFSPGSMPPFPLLYYAQNNSNSTPPNKSKDHCVKNNVHFYNKKCNVSWRWKNLSYYHVTTVAVLFCYFRCCLLYSIAISLSSVLACRNDVIHQSFNLREGVDRFKVVELKKSGKIIYIILFRKHFSH